MRRVTRLRTFRHAPRIFLLAPPPPYHLRLSTTTILAEPLARHEMLSWYQTELTSTVGAFLILETEKRGCELGINTFHHFVCPATFGIALILNVHTYVSDRYRNTASAISLHLTPPSYLS